MNDLLVAQGVNKSFPSGAERLQILSELSLAVAQGEIVAITGASGSGKSTLLHILGGMDRPDSGSIRVLQTELASLGSVELSGFRNRTVGFVFQFHHLLPEFTALENIVMPLLLRGESRSRTDPLGLSLLEEVGLERRAHHRPGELSGGEQQRVAVARALIGRPKLLLADEPTGNLDAVTGEQIAQLIQNLHSSHGLTTILVTHNERLARICSRSYRLAGGKLV